MITDIFLRSYASDLPWVRYALRSLQKFVTGIRDIIISVPEEDLRGFKDLHLVKEIVVPSKVPTRNGYMDQMQDKLMADLYTGADYILYWDSDCIAVKPFSPADLFVDRTPRWLMTPYSKLITPDGKPDTPWQPITEKAIVHSVEHEFMRAHPFIVPWEALGMFRRFMQSTHGCSVGEYIERQPGRSFSEWNALGAWAYLNARELFYFWDTTGPEGVPEPVIRQFWSYAGITPDIRAEIDRILS